MQIQNWGQFKDRFNHYIRNTFGLFTLRENTSFIHFDLDHFLARQVDNAQIDKPNSITQNEMLMSLSTFIDIEEANDNLTSAALTARVMNQLHYLIEKNYIQIHPFSQIKKDCKPPQLVVLVAAAAAAA
jgi:hypothetical protein